MEERATGGVCLMFKAWYWAPPAPGEPLLCHSPWGHYRDEDSSVPRNPPAHGKDSPEKSGPECHPNLTLWARKVQAPSWKVRDLPWHESQVSAQAALAQSSHLQLLISKSSDFQWQWFPMAISNTLGWTSELKRVPPEKAGHPKNTMKTRENGVSSFLGQVLWRIQDFWKYKAAPLKSFRSPWTWII